MSGNKQINKKKMTLRDRLLRIDSLQASRFGKLEGAALEIATEGIIRHLRACARMDVPEDVSAIREIIDDAHSGRRVWATEDRATAAN